VPFEFIDDTYEYLREKESVRLEDLDEKQLGDYENASYNVITHCLMAKTSGDDISVSLAQVMFHFPDTSIPRAKRILDYMGKVDKMRVDTPRPLSKNMEKLVMLASKELTPDQRNVADISRHLEVGILTSKRVRAVLVHLEGTTDVEKQEVAIESLRKAPAKAPAKKAAAAAAMPEPEMETDRKTRARPKAEPKARSKSEPLVCAVCGENPPTIRHFDCGQLVCDDCIRKANATRSMSKHLPTICPKCKMPIIEGSSDEVL
jgi:hypothetical protein